MSALFDPRRTMSMVAAALALLLGGADVLAQSTSFVHIGRYNHQFVGRDHLVGTIAIKDHYAVTCSYDALRVIDLDALPSGEGSSDFVSELRGHDVVSIVKLNDEYLYASVRLGGVGIVRIDPVTFAIEWLQTIAEPGVYYEALRVVDHRLWVAAHRFGIRVFDLSNPELPIFVGGLSEGFTDAFAIDVVGDTAYVADGAGGLKIVDVSDPTNMQIVAGEVVRETAIGTAEDVVVVNGNVYVAGGSAGVLYYPGGAIGQRVRYDTPTVAMSLAVAGDYLALGDVGSLELFGIQPDGTLQHLTREGGMHRFLGSTTQLTLRLWHRIAAWGDDRIISANWDAIDVYQIVSDGSIKQPDITASNQRVRFHVDGGQTVVTLQNLGTAPLQIGGVTSSASNFTVTPTGPATIPVGGAIDLTIQYTPGTAGQTLITIASDDPDEGMLPITAFGNTVYIDPGEPAAPFSLPLWIYNHDSMQFEYGTFTLADFAGKVVYFQVYGTWCPACLPVVADLQNSVVAEFEGHPQVVTAIMSQKEQAPVLEEYWDNLYLRAPMIFDLFGATAQFAYAQPPTGLPFSRGFVIGPDQIVVDTIFGANSERVIAEIRSELAKIAIPGDTNLDGTVDGADLGVLLGAWGPCPAESDCLADMNGDGAVDGSDLGMLLSHFGDIAGP